jgi:DNA-binding SARP family transcriptional activator
VSGTAIRLRTLGELRLEGVELAGHSRRRKELVLLAYLARRAPRTLSRGEAAALLWDQRDERHARQSLRQALTELRRVAGDALTAEGDRIAVAPGAVTLDAAELEQAVSEGRHEDAVRLWAGDFLPGVEELAGETLRGWLEAEREGLRRTLEHALERLVAAAAERGAWDAAAAWAERWCAHSPGDERAHGRHVEALCMAGRAPEASARHAGFVARLRADSEREPSAEVRALEARIGRDLQRDRPRHQPGSAALFTPDLIGRESSLGELRAAWETARAGEPTIVLVEGDTGIGKTRIMEEFVRRVAGEAGVTWLSASEIPPGDGPAEVILDRLANASGLAAASAPVLAAVAARVPAVRRRFAGLSETTGGVPFDAAVSAAMAAIADERPLLVVLDDAEQLTSAALARLAASVPAASAVLVVLAAGPGEGPQAQPGLGAPVGFCSSR